MLSGLLRLYPALENPAFRLLWLGMLPSTLAWQMSVVSSGYAALVLSGSATAIGMVASATGFPMLLFSLVGGVVADRLPRRVVLIASQSVLGAGAAAVAALSLTGLLQVWHLVALSLSQGVAFSFNMPARQAYTAELVGPRLMQNAVALNNAGMNFCRIAGPALAGAMLAVPGIGIGGVFLVMTAMYAAVLATLVRLPRHSCSAEKARPGPSGSSVDQLLEGLRYIRRSPVLAALLGLAFVTAVFGMPYQQLMPVFSEHVFQVSAAGLGLLMSANGVGALVGSLAIAALSDHPRPSLLQLALGAVFGVALIAFAMAPSFPVAVVLLVVVGFASASYLSINNALLMSNAEPRLYGRVMSVYLLTFAVMPLATLPMAWLTDLAGARATVAAAGLIVTATLLVAGAVYPPLRRID